MSEKQNLKSSDSEKSDSTTSAGTSNFLKVFTSRLEAALITQISIITVSLLIIASVLIAVSLKSLAPILKPLLIAIFLFYLIHPLASFLQSYRFPSFIAYFVVVFLILILITGIGSLVVKDFQDLYRSLPFYQEKLYSVTGKIMLDLKASPYMDLIAVEDVSWVKDLFQGFFKTLLDIFVGTSFNYVTNLFGVMIFFIFIVLEAKTFSSRIERAFNPETSEKLLRIFHNINQNIHHYIVIKTIISLFTALTAWLVMYLFGLKYALLWAILTFLLNFIPYLGSIIATIPPVLIALLQLTNLQTIFMGVLLWLIQLIFGNLLDPKLAGDKLNISPIIILISMAFWGYIWGAVGILFSVPIAVTIKIILLNFNFTQPLASLISHHLERDNSS